MADTSSKSEGRKSARKHSGLGRGLGALIPQAGEQSSQASPSSPSRPLDVFFPEGSSAGSRGGSAKDPLSTPLADVAVQVLVTVSVVESMAQIPAMPGRVCP